MKWQSVVFDLDDTLYPEKDYIFSGFHVVAEWMETQTGLLAKTSHAELRQLFETGVRGNTFDYWLTQRGLQSDALISQLIKVYREHIPTLRVFPEIMPILNMLHGSSKLGIISDGYLAVQRKKFDALGIAPYFDEVIFSDTWGRENWKPSEKPFREALRQLKTPPDQTVYIGDNPLKDFFGARSCGWFTIWLRRENGEYSHLTPPSAEHAAHVTVQNHAELMRFFERDDRA